MKVTWEWLAEFVELDLTVDQLAERLTMAGLEIESVERMGAGLESVSCAEVVRVNPHPRADRLHVCEVRGAGDSLRTVVCGAPDVRAGARVAYAAPGTVLGDGRRIEAAEVRGVASAGMLCSEAELELGSDDRGLMALPATAPVGTPLFEALGLDTVVLDVSITPNRGDCLSVLGLAREIAALTGRRLRRHRVDVRETGREAAELVRIRIEAPDLCARYVGRVVEDVRVGPSPLRLQHRLRSVGMRPINNVVDVTNYVLIERGQPLHAFDFDRLPEPAIVVRRAGKAAAFETLDGQERRVDADDLMITSGGRWLAVAGVMGGSESDVRAETRRILLESAWFLPGTVRRTSKRLGLRSESSYRFERCTDIEGVATAANRAAGLIGKLAGGRVARGCVDLHPGRREEAPISLRVQRVEDLLGMNVSRAEVTSKLKALGMQVSPATRGALTVVPPSWRSDVRREIDLIEEIIRLVGYEQVPTTLPQATLGGGAERSDRRQLARLRQTLLALGFCEAVPLSFCSTRLNTLFPGLDPAARPVVVLNPLQQDEGEMRLSLCSSLARVVGWNLDQKAESVALFTVGKVFWRTESFAEANRLGGVVCRSLPAAGLGRRDAVAEFADVKGVVEAVLAVAGAGSANWAPVGDHAALHPGLSARLSVGADVLGFVGAVHPRVVDELGLAAPCWLFELDLDKLLQYGRTPVIFRELPRFPAIIRDLAVMTAEDFAADSIVRFVREWGADQPWIEEVGLFDEYVGAPIPAGRKSLAYTISYRAADRTLTDAEVNEVHSRLTAALTGTLGVELR